MSFKVEVSYMEIYNEKVRDLLCPKRYEAINERTPDLASFNLSVCGKRCTMNSCVILSLKCTKARIS